ncbi:ABC transporter ATP-binding protein [Reyranella sp.]|uniref:ABC transporter ATP-binding protein n=1 Tax=Reyranella sp. TaxID=1929291 RepID=UPI0012197AF2|nr:oligopeptide/dipeptide ABC transporter ATP-binding protein [Reyranella sp.]TAJ83909.1 MAG: ATP-binding cassette domain-containing protein [Reyranella sp.]
MNDLLRISDLVVEYPVGGGRRVHAVSGVTLTVRDGETLGLVGESGSGKSSLARALLQLPPPQGGSVLFDGNELTQLRGKALRAVRPRLQMIFQDPIASLNPRRKVAEIIAEPLIVSGVADAAERTRRVRSVMEAVGLDPDLVWNRRPHEFSGGQCQRIAIARALVLEPSLIVCDEPVSALDVSIRAQILNLLEDMKARFGLTLLFIAHDLAVVKSVSDRVAVMYLGKLCEVASSEDLFASPAHPYTAALMAAIPEPDPDLPLGDTKLKPGDPPSPLDPPSGCRFRTRCPLAEPRCATEVPPLRAIAPGREVACHFPLVA